MNIYDQGKNLDDTLNAMDKGMGRAKFENKKDQKPVFFQKSPKKAKVGENPSKSSPITEGHGKSEDSKKIVTVRKKTYVN